jgi:hypothetical protein
LAWASRTPAGSSATSRSRRSPEEARPCFEQALAVATTYEAYYEAARPRLDLVTLLAGSDPARAGRLARQALALFAEAKAALWEARARALLEGRE